jgi:hypothetical protein
LRLAEMDTFFYLFSRSGFTESLIWESEGDERLRLVDLNDLFDV